LVARLRPGWQGPHGLFAIAAQPLGDRGGRIGRGTEKVVRRDTHGLGVPYATYYATTAASIRLTSTTDSKYAPQHIPVNTVLPGLMQMPMVEKSAGLAVQYDGSDVAEVCKARDAQCPMGRMGDGWDVA
jgi:NAD(P)-dependent dehydrogenase (short-subunit alcohol dehydrogenase family)